MTAKGFPLIWQEDDRFSGDTLFGDLSEGWYYRSVQRPHQTSGRPPLPRYEFHADLYRRDVFGNECHLWGSGDILVQYEWTPAPPPPRNHFRERLYRVREEVRRDEEDEDSGDSGDRSDREDSPPGRAQEDRVPDVRDDEDHDLELPFAGSVARPVEYLADDKEVDEDAMEVDAGNQEPRPRPVRRRDSLDDLFVSLPPSPAPVNAAPAPAPHVVPVPATDGVPAPTSATVVDSAPAIAPALVALPSPVKRESPAEQDTREQLQALFAHAADFTRRFAWPNNTPPPASTSSSSWAHSSPASSRCSSPDQSTPAQSGSVPPSIKTEVEPPVKIEAVAIKIEDDD